MNFLTEQADRLAVFRGFLKMKRQEKYIMKKDFDELTIADDIAKQCTSCTLLSYKFSIEKKNERA